MPWINSAGFKVYIHNQSEGFYSESPSYSVGPGFHTTLSLRYVSFCRSKFSIFHFLQKEYSRMKEPFGECVDSVDEVGGREMYYYDGPYETDGCLRSCYQRGLLAECGCMDPAYPHPDNVEFCELNFLFKNSKTLGRISNYTCVADFQSANSDPSAFPGCRCPSPCLWVYCFFFPFLDFFYSKLSFLQ